MIDNILSYNYLNNVSELLELFKDDFIINIFNNINNKDIYFNSTLIHNNKKISLKELFIFNIDLYITFIKRLIHIDSFELRYIIKLTLNNKSIKLLINDKYYYDNEDYYNKLFIKIFMYQYNKNIKLLSNFIDIKKRPFIELVDFINNHKKRVYPYFEKINNKNINFFIEIISYIENITL